MSAPQVTIIGAGIVGVASALWLQREGFKVTLVDAGGVGEGASSGNAGNISPGAVVPYTIPGVLLEVPGWLLDPDGPLVVRPGYFLKAMPFLMALARASRTDPALRTSRAMRELHRTTFEAYDSLTRNTEAEGLIDKCGQLYVSQKPNGAQGSMLTQFMRDAAGVKTVVLKENEIYELEPSLAPIFKSGMLLPGNGRTLNPLRLVQVLAGEAQRLGANVVRGKVTGFQMDAGRVRSVLIDGAPVNVERVLVTAGAASGILSASLGATLPVEPEGGYHCPLCGEQSSLDQWWTPSQVSFAQSAAAQAFTEQLGSELGALVRSRAEGLFRVDVESVSVPARLVEPNDLGIALSPCHPEEPVKVPAVLGEAMYCLMCGSAFAT